MRSPLLATIFSALLFSTSAKAAPVVYFMDPARSTVAFETDFGPDKITGTFPLEAADLTLDFAHVSNCKITVVLNVSGAEASFPFAAQALKGPKVLDAKAYPKMTFQSTSVKSDGAGALVTGNLVIRGVSRPVVLRAEIYRKAGTAAGDLQQLTVKLTGTVQRSAFGATGWSDMVSDEVRIVITAGIKTKG